uniref:Transposase n=1 Tax=Acrobeloides nanus TaxID=290746 RepID=A0A914D2A6_9BILA
MSTGELSEGEIVDSDGEQVLDPSQGPVDGLEDLFDKPVKIIPLPEHVQVKTGEENEQALFEGRNKRGHRVQPLFEHRIWNCYDVTLHCLPRTNNGLEALNNAFKISVGITHPTFSTFMNRLVDKHAKICYDIMQPEREVSLTKNEVYLIDVVRSYDRYANF